MKKISKIYLENFRIFSGKNEINFNTSNKKPADFVCIYGKNGFGKTSLFDGFEWFFLGEVHLLKKDLKSNVSKYTGDILKYKYAREGEKVGVGIQYSDGEEGYRTVVKKANSANDYGKGMPSAVCKDMLDEKQILPHSKIDSFVYATKPSDMYNEWGNFWDPDNRQRGKFEAVYKVYKKISNEIKEYDEKLEGIENKLKKLNIEQKVRDYNKSVETYNRLLVKNVPDLHYIEYSMNNKISINCDLFGQKIAEQLNTYILKQKLIKNQCDFLQNKFNDYQSYIYLQQETLNKKKIWEKIISKCQKKREFLLQTENLENEEKRLIESRNKLLDEFDILWFDSYQQYIKMSTQYQSLNVQLENKKIDIQNTDNYIEKIQKNIEKLEQKKSGVLIKSESWGKQIEELEVQEKALFQEDVVNSFKNKIKNNDNQRKIYENELLYLKKATVGEYEKFIESLNSDEMLLYPWIKEWNEEERKLKKELDISRRKEKEAKCEYEKMQRNVNSLENLLTLAKNEISKNDTCMCPVCKSKFSSREELLDKIDMSAQQEILLRLKKQWEFSSEELKKAEEGYNRGCENIKILIKTKIYRIEQVLVGIEQESTQYKKEWIQRQELIQEIKDKKEKLKQNIEQDTGKNIESLSVQSVGNVCEQSIFMINQKLVDNQNILKEKQDLQRKFAIEIKQKESVIDEIKEKIKDFNSNSSNLHKREIMEQREIFSYSEFQKIIEEYARQIQQCESQKKEIQGRLKKYKIYYTDNIGKYKEFLETKKIKYEDWVDQYEQYKEKIFQKQNISRKTIQLYLKKVDFNINIAEEKLNIWNECISDVIIKEFVNEYNGMIEEKEKIQQNKSFCENKEKIAKDIFQTVRTQLEEYIKRVFGGVTISQIYSKIEPHKRFTKLQYKVSINDNGVPELYMKVLNDKNEDIMPELFFSSAQLNTVALSVFLGGALSTSNPKVNTIFIDDPIGHFDDLNVLSFIDVLRTIISETDWQIIISTHEESFYEIMKVKLNPKYYNSKFLIFKDEGNVEEDLKV